MKMRKTVSYLAAVIAMVSLLMTPMQTLAASGTIGTAMILADTMGSAVGGALTAAVATVASLVLGRKKRNLLEEDDFDNEI